MDDDLLDDALFGSYDDDINDDDDSLIVNITQTKKKKRSYGSFPLKPSSELRNMKRELDSDLSKHHLKNPPVFTQRTIPALSTSAPQGFHLNELPFKITKHTPTSYKSQRDNYKGEDKSKNKKSTPPQFDIQYLNINEQLTHNSEDPRKSICSHHPTSIEHDLRMVHIRDSKELTDKPNLVGYEEDNSMIGSVPHSNFLKEVHVKQDINTRKKNLLNRKQKTFGQYTTISTISFNTFLSPDTPKFVLGNPKTAKIRILITTGIHGDEPCGIMGFNELMREGFFKKLPSHISVTGVVGNPAAVAKNVRFIEFNLNRMIRKDLFTKGAYECERARVVANEINHCDILLDLHSCSAKSPAHALPADSNASIELASLLPVGYVIKYLVHTTSGQATTVDWARNKNKTSLCVECGQHEERQTIENAKNVIRTLVTLQIENKRPNDIVNFPPPVILNSKENETVRKGFKFVRPIKAFDMVPYGEVIAVDDVVGEMKSIYKKGTYIVMPTRKPVFGEEAWFHAELSENLYD